MKPTIRCSNLDRLLGCPASRTLDLLDEQRLADGGNVMTWRGNWIHWESARRLVLEHGAVAPSGLPAPLLPPGWKPQPWDERAADWYVENVVANTPPDHAIVVEHHLELAFPRFLLSGHLDTYSISPDLREFAIKDDKTGPNEVDHAESNWQLAGYATLIKAAYPTATRGTASILQRTATEPITTVEIDDLDVLAGFIERQVNDALDRRLELNTGYKQCRLCRNSLFCPAIPAEIDAMKIILTEEQIAALTVTSNLKQLAETAYRGRAIAGPIERLLEATKERVAAEGDVVLADGTAVRVVEELGRRSVSAPKVAHALLTEKVGEDAAWETLAMSLTATEDQLHKIGMKKTSKTGESAAGWVRDTLGHLITRSMVRKLKFT